MIVEFIGLPGSGKTYLSKKLKDFLGVNFLDRDDILLNNLSYTDLFVFIRRNFLLILLFYLGFVLNLSANLRKNYALFCGINDMLRIYAFIHAHPEKNFLLDEGLHQRLLSVFFYKKFVFNRILLRAALSVINSSWQLRPDFFVVMDISIFRAIKNATKRDTGLPFRFKDLSMCDLLSKYLSMLEGMEIISKFYLNNSNEVKIIKIKEFKDFEEILNILSYRNKISN